MWAIWNKKGQRWLVAGSDNFVRVFTNEQAAGHWVTQGAMPPEYVIRPVVLESPKPPSEESENTHHAM
jgi:hypothetical protein